MAPRHTQDSASQPADRHGMQARVTTVLAEPMRVIYASTTQETARLHMQTQRAVNASRPVDCEHNRAAARPVLTLPTTDFVSWD